MNNGNPFKSNTKISIEINGLEVVRSRFLRKISKTNSGDFQCLRGSAPLFETMKEALGCRQWLKNIANFYLFVGTRWMFNVNLIDMQEWRKKTLISAHNKYLQLVMRDWLSRRIVYTIQFRTIFM
ncbi:hypothetical protein L1987_79622 [Smallanthus sonchifolius]|uniref:Uncharacterized protein n=1 Tax=Smallanthus sonchifolius TaxID=185202 RepID=A0ACB8YLG2_9ASTR|nr:hypothetical protein L1987_79622 [Smallanthus sonchifolius]